MSVESRRRSRLRRPDFRRAAPALPNGFTLGNLFFGIFAIVSAARGSFGSAVLYVVLGGVCDAFDGAAARATRTGGPFGEELDSLVDAISFGLAPAMIVYFLVLPQATRWGWLPVFFFCACAVIRLARFNVTQAGASKSYFIGLPTPAAGGTLATYYWFTQTSLYNQTTIVDLPWQEMMVGLMLVLSIMMISQVPYPAWPKVGIRSWQGVAGLLVVLGIVAGATLYSKYFFFLFGVGYVTYGLVRALALAMFEWPNGGTPTRRATDYDDPLDAYGSPAVGDMRRDGRRAAVSEPDGLDESPRSGSESGRDAAGLSHEAERRRRRRRRRSSTADPGHVVPASPDAAPRDGPPAPSD